MEKNRKLRNRPCIYTPDYNKSSTAERCMKTDFLINGSQSIGCYLEKK